jgi:hypothetical protein
MIESNKNFVWGRSHYHKWCNQTVYWCPSDDKETFKENLSNSNTKKLLEQNGWLDKDITYTFNKYGYRCDSFDLPCEVLFAGCSQTIGIGLPLDVLWASRVADHLKIPYHNIACGGADWQHTAQRLCYWLPILKPKVLILKHPPSDRFNWWDQLTTVSTCEFNEEELMSCRINESRPLIDIVQPNNSAWYCYSMLMLIKQVCHDLNTKLIEIPTGRLNHEDANRQSDLARDLMHFGKREQDYSYRYTLDKLSNEEYS